MRKKLIDAVILSICLCPFFLFHLTDNANTELKMENHKDTKAKSIQVDDRRNKTDLLLYSDTIHTILEKNSNKETAFLDKYPTALRWIQISAFDFTGDGNMEIIISDEYVETSAIISYNSVYDDCGNFLFEFVADDILDTEIFVNETKSQYHIRSSLHIAASHDVTLYEEILQDPKWEARLMLAEWDCRHGKEREDNDQEGYLIFDCFTQDEISNIMVTGYENMINVFRCKEANGTVEQLQKYVLSFESQQKESVTAIGTILNWEEGIKWE